MKKRLPKLYSFQIASGVASLGTSITENTKGIVNESTFIIGLVLFMIFTSYNFYVEMTEFDEK